MRIRFVAWLNMGLGVMYFPLKRQIGIVFLVWSLVLSWDHDDDGDDGEEAEIPEEAAA